ncbi:expressed unknown protein [Seminavis robusta]|uniref:Uncharacterized protein n=1 Tax=Seminavis robusta TaxID=568900 RepID=A0A9N8HK31_9STRA|nr:expressed unknown protein [Seminavis robusta]|eukprot:Sro726_g193540.1 n/a (1390) ;mRNA; f:42096-46265
MDYSFSDSYEYVGDTTTSSEGHYSQSPSESLSSSARPNSTPVSRSGNSSRGASARESGRSSYGSGGGASVDSSVRATDGQGRVGSRASSRSSRSSQKRQETRAASAPTIGLVLPIKPNKENRNTIGRSSHDPIIMTSQPSSELPVLAAPEVDYTGLTMQSVNSTPLFEAIRTREWRLCFTFLRNDYSYDGSMLPPQDQVRAWVSMYRSDGVLLYTRLPIHEALSRGAPADLIHILLQQHPLSVEIQDSNGNLPLHLAMANNAERLVIELIIQEYPLAMEVTNGQGKLPSECGRLSRDANDSSPLRGEVLKKYVDSAKEVASQQVPKLKDKLFEVNRTIEAAKSELRVAKMELGMIKQQEKMRLQNKEKEENRMKEEVLRLRSELQSLRNEQELLSAEKQLWAEKALFQQDHQEQQGQQPQPQPQQQQQQHQIIVLSDSDSDDTHWIATEFSEMVSELEQTTRTVHQRQPSKRYDRSAEHYKKSQMVSKTSRGGITTSLFRPKLDTMKLSREFRELQESVTESTDLSQDLKDPQLSVEDTETSRASNDDDDYLTIRLIREQLERSRKKLDSRSNSEDKEDESSRRSGSSHLVEGAHSREKDERFLSLDERLRGVVDNYVSVNERLKNVINEPDNKPETQESPPREVTDKSPPTHGPRAPSDSAPEQREDPFIGLANIRNDLDGDASRDSGRNKEASLDILPRSTHKSPVGRDDDVPSLTRSNSDGRNSQSSRRSGRDALEGISKVASDSSETSLREGNRKSPLRRTRSSSSSPHSREEGSRDKKLHGVERSSADVCGRISREGSPKGDENRPRTLDIESTVLTEDDLRSINRNYQSIGATRSQERPNSTMIVERPGSILEERSTSVVVEHPSDDRPSSVVVVENRRPSSVAVVEDPSSNREERPTSVVAGSQGSFHSRGSSSTQKRGHASGSPIDILRSKSSSNSKLEKKLTMLSENTNPTTARWNCNSMADDLTCQDDEEEGSKEEVTGVIMNKGTLLASIRSVLLASDGTTSSVQQEGSPPVDDIVSVTDVSEALDRHYEEQRHEGDEEEEGVVVNKNALIASIRQVLLASDAASDSGKPETAIDRSDPAVAERSYAFKTCEDDDALSPLNKSVLLASARDILLAAEGSTKKENPSTGINRNNTDVSDKSTVLWKSYGPKVEANKEVALLEKRELLASAREILLASEEASVSKDDEEDARILYKRARSPQDSVSVQHQLSRVSALSTHLLASEDERDEAIVDDRNDTSVGDRSVASRRGHVSFADETTIYEEAREGFSSQFSKFDDVVDKAMSRISLKTNNGSSRNRSHRRGHSRGRGNPRGIVQPMTAQAMRHIYVTGEDRVEILSSEPKYTYRPGKSSSSVAHSEGAVALGGELYPSGSDGYTSEL